MKGELEDKVTGLQFTATTILQPSLLLGKREAIRLGEGLASFVLPSLAKIPGMHRFKPISSADVAKKLLQCSLQPQPMNKLRLDEVFPT